ncbi:hypothetical protein CM15mP35_10340 [bacterium]|nr:MAG: hypothetical protein CM15mP35_10340 [bacterium]
MILETHAHADHLSGAQFMKDKFPKSKLAIGENIKSVQKLLNIYSILKTLMKMVCNLIYC